MKSDTYETASCAENQRLEVSEEKIFKKNRKPVLLNLLRRKQYGLMHHAYDYHNLLLISEFTLKNNLFRNSRYFFLEKP